MPETPQPLPCIVCKKTLTPVFADYSTPSGYVQPNDANTLGSSGNYGSTVFDPLDGSYVIVNVCDTCLSTGLEEGTSRIYPADGSYVIANVCDTCLSTGLEEGTSRIYPAQ